MEKTFFKVLGCQIDTKYKIKLIINHQTIFGISFGWVFKVWVVSLEYNFSFYMSNCLALLKNFDFSLKSKRCVFAAMSVGKIE